MPGNNTGGGAATAAGITFQENVAAWLVCQILAEQNRTNDLELPADAVLETITCESLEPINDIVVGASDRTLYFQCKTTLSIGPNRDFVKVIQQFAEQFLKFGRPEDRYVLAVSDTSSAILKTSLRSLLKSLRGKRDSQRNEELEKHRSVLSQYEILEATVREQLQMLQRGKLIDDEDVRSLIDRVMIYSAPFGAGASSPDAATDKLALVLTKPEDGQRAWEHIVSIVRDFSPKRTGGNRHTFVQSLREEGYIAKPLAKVREAITALQARNRDYLAKLSIHTSIKLVGRSPVEIDRPIVKQIFDELQKGSLLVCGEAGAGKTGCLVQVARLLDQAEIPLIVLPVERVFLGSDPNLAIGIPAGVSLDEVLNGWPTDKYGVLCLDGLDAARSSVSLKSVLDVVYQLQTVAPDWKVLASIREYDLERSDEIRRVFRGAVSEAVLSSHVSGVRAIRVPQLTDAEIEQLYPVVPVLRNILQHEQAVGLRALAKNVFNLDLLVDMLTSHADLHELQLIDTQDKLLETYWSLRVGEEPNRTIPLTELTRIMVEQRSVAVHVHSELTSRLSELFSNSLLTQESGLLPEDPKLVRYRHNILFDYALSRLWLRGLSNKEVLAELAKSPDLALVFRPSLRMTLQRLWRKDPTRKAFWNRIAAWFQTESMSDIAKLSVTQVAAEEFREIQDLSPLLDAFEEPVKADLLEGIIAAALMQLRVDREAFDIVGPYAASWLRLTETLAERNSIRFSYALRNVLVAVLDGSPNGREKLTDEQRSTFTSIGCGLLDTCIADGSEEVVKRELLGVAVRACLFAISWDREKPIAALKRALTPDFLAKAGFVVLPLLGEEITALADVSENFAEQVFKFYLTAPAQVGNPVTSFGGPIFSMTSSAVQELSMFEFSVGTVFEELVTSHPELAARVMRLIVQQHWMRRDLKLADKRDDDTTDFMFDGAIRKYIRDHSYIWDSGQTYNEHDLWRKAADTVFMVLKADTTSAALRQSLFDVVLTEADLGAIWNRLLLAAAFLPAHFGERLAPLLTQTVFLRESETRHAVGKLLEQRFATWCTELRRQIEVAIMQVGREGHHFTNDGINRAERLRNSLIACLPNQAIVNDEVRLLYARISSNELAAPPSVPYAVIKSGFISDEDYLRERGQLETEAQRRFFKLSEEVKRLGRSNGSLTANDIPQVLETVNTFERFLAVADSDNIASDQSQHAVGEIAAVFSNLANIEEIQPTDGEVILQRLLVFSTHAEPTPGDDDDACWDSESPYWGSPFPRIEAAWGLMRLAQHAKDLDEPTRTAILRLANDMVPAVRYPIIVESFRLYSVATDSFWKLIEFRAEKEEKLALLQRIVEVLLRFSPKSEHADRVDQTIRRIESRIADRENAGFVRKTIVVHRLRRWIYVGDQASKHWLDGLVDSRFERSEELKELLRLWEELLSNPQSTEVMSSDEIVSHGIEALLRAFDASYADWNEKPWKNLDRDEARSAYYRATGPMQHIVDITSLLLDLRSHPTKPAPREDYERISHMVKTFRPLIEKCANVPVASAAYDFLRTLQYISPVVPGDAMRWVRTLVRSAAMERFLSDFMGAELLIDLLERYLVEHRDLLSDDATTRESVIDLLNDCVHYGWPKAGPLLVRLHEVFRA